jgi:hypothetical protein
LRFGVIEEDENNIDSFRNIADFFSDRFRGGKAP